MLASNPQPSTWDHCGYNPGWSTVKVPEGEGGGAFPLEGLSLWISPSFISYQSTSSSSFRAKLQAYFFPFSLESFNTVLCIYYRASLGCDLGLGFFPPLSKNALIWVWFAGREGSDIFFVIYLFFAFGDFFFFFFSGLHLVKVLGNHLDTDASELTFNICMCEDAYRWIMHSNKHLGDWVWFRAILHMD